MSLLREESNDEESDSKFLFNDRMISIDSQSLSSQSSVEEPILNINTNLNEAQLATFQNYKTDDESKLSICQAENPISVEFTKEDINYNVSIALLLPDKDEKHDRLKLVPVNDEYLIHKGEIIFKINRELLKLKLDFFGIKFTDEHEDNLDIDEAYSRNTARLFLKKYDNSEKVVTSYKSQIIRNKNFEVSEDISVLQIIRDRKRPTKCILRLDHSVPYFPDEMEIEIDGHVTDYLLSTERGFPIRELLISIHEKIKCNLSNTRIICKIFQKESIPRPIKKNRAIENLKIKESKQNQGYSKPSQTNSSALVQKSRKSKEMCLVINQIIFDDKNIKSRESHSKTEIIEIETVFSEILNYDVHIISDSTTQQLKDEIRNKLDNFKCYHDHIVVFVFSHGDNDKFHTRDGSMKYDEFLKLFLPLTCQQISDKAKLFFIACCLGKKVNTIHKSFIPEGITESTSARSESFIKIENRPECSNVFIGFSTFSGYYSFRVNNLTPYIQTLLYVIRENPALEVREIQDITQSRVNWEESLTIPSVTHSLTRKVYFKQKKNS